MRTLVLEPHGKPRLHVQAHHWVDVRVHGVNCRHILVKAGLKIPREAVQRLLGLLSIYAALAELRLRVLAGETKPRTVHPMLLRLLVLKH